MRLCLQAPQCEATYMKKLLVVLGVPLALAGSSCDGTETSYSQSPSPSFDTATTIIDTGDEVVLVETEVADSDAERSKGLMYRKNLDEDEGMLFVFFEENTGGFWMKNTLIPLSIAFFDDDGKIVSIMDMDPCRKEPCKVYDPGVPYWGALEVNQGAFERWGVEEGDIIRSNQ